MSDEINKVEEVVKKVHWSSFFEESPGELSMTRLVMFLSIEYSPLLVYSYLAVERALKS